MFRSQEKLKERTEANQPPLITGGESTVSDKHDQSSLLQRLTPFLEKAPTAEMMWAKANFSMETMWSQELVFLTENLMVNF